jgi:hypothetical protein
MPGTNTSLSRKSVNYGQKSFITLTPEVSRNLCAEAEAVGGLEVDSQRIRHSGRFGSIDTREYIDCSFAWPACLPCFGRIVMLPATAYPPFTWTMALLIFVMSNWFCQDVCPILPGSPTNFEIGIFLSRCPILCNLCQIGSQRFQMKLSINL